MANDTNLRFIQDRIFEIRSALLYSLNNTVFSFPTTIVTALNVDQAGYIWFLVKQPKPGGWLDQEHFPAKLQFFRKGKPFYLLVSGNGCIVRSIELMNQLVDAGEKLTIKAMEEMVLLKVRMESVEYFEQSEEKKWSDQIYFWYNSLVNRIRTWLHKPSVRIKEELQKNGNTGGYGRQIQPAA